MWDRYVGRHLRRQALHSNCLTLAVVLLVALSTEAAVAGPAGVLPPPTGTFAGKTSRGQPISFSIKGGYLRHISVRVHDPCGHLPSRTFTLDRAILEKSRADFFPGGGHWAINADARLPDGTPILWFVTPFGYFTSATRAQGGIGGGYAVHKANDFRPIRCGYGLPGQHLTWTATRVG